MFTFLPKKKRVKNTSETVAAFSLYIYDFEYEKSFSVKRNTRPKFWHFVHFDYINILR